MYILIHFQFFPPTNSIEHGKQHRQDAIFSLFMKSKIMSGRVRDKRKDRELEFFMKWDIYALEVFGTSIEDYSKNFSPSLIKESLPSHSCSCSPWFPFSSYFSIFSLLLSLSLFLFRLFSISVTSCCLSHPHPSIHTGWWYMISPVVHASSPPSLTLSIFRKICLFTGLDSIEEVGVK